MAFERASSDDRNGEMAVRERRGTIEKNESERDNNHRYPNQKALSAAHETIPDVRVQYLSYEMRMMGIHRVGLDLISREQIIPVCWAYHAWWWNKNTRRRPPVMTSIQRRRCALPSISKS
jgi:hypothetical protein